MRFLFTIHPMYGHFHAMTPLAHALQDHGHEVIFATGATFGSVIERVGFHHVPCGIDFDGSTDIFESLFARKLIASKPVGGEQQLRIFAQEVAPNMIEDVLELAKHWRPDVIIRDPVEFGGYIAAECLHVPHAGIIWAFYISGKYSCTDILTDLRQQYGLPDDPELTTLDQYLLLDFLPSSWTLPYIPYPPVAHRFCLPPFDQSGEETAPTWLKMLPNRPTIYATLGTTFNQSPATFQAILEALGAEDVNGIVTVGRSMDVSQFQPFPDNVKIAHYIPQSLILPHCDAMIFHGGYNSLLSALWHGLPMVLTPLEAGDQFPTAQRCAEVGIGVLVEERPPGSKTIRNAIRTILEQPSYRRQAQQLQRDIQALPALSEAVKRLEILARTREPQLNVA